MVVVWKEVKFGHKPVRTMHFKYLAKGGRPVTSSRVPDTDKVMHLRLRALRT